MQQAANREEQTKYEPVGELVRIFQRGPTWYANFQLKGRQHRRSLKTTNKKTAQRQARLIEVELLKGEYEQPVSIPSIASVIEQHLKHVRTKGGAAKTLVKYEDVYRRVQQLATELRRPDIMGIDLGFVDEFRYRRSMAERSPKTIYNESMIIRGLVNFARSRKLISKDPLEGFTLKEPKPRPQPCWSPTEVEQILSTCRDHHRPALTVLADTGMRIGELVWFTWDDADLGIAKQ